MIPFPPDPEKLTLDTMELYRKHFGEGLSNLLQFGGYGVEWSADGCLVYDATGREYIDCVGIFGVLALGHRRAEVVEAMVEQLHRLPLSTRSFFSDAQARLADELSAVLPGNLSRIFFCHSGTEAVEGAIKLVRASTGRPGVVSTLAAYHGKTLGSLSASGREKYKIPYAPLLPGFAHVPYGDARAMEAAITSETAAVIVEPVQGEGGVIVPPVGYLRDLRALCDRTGTLFILDEVQTGFGRTGKLFACEHESVTPDVITLAKALGGGVAPLAAFATTPDHWDRMFGENPFIHSTTVTNVAAMAAARVSLRILQEENLAARAAQTGAQFLGELKDIQQRFPQWIKDVRGKGLLIGVEMVHSDLALLTTQFLSMRGVIVAYTLNNPRVIRIEPPLIISEEQVQTVLAAFRESVAQAVALAQSLEPADPSGTED